MSSVGETENRVEHLRPRFYQLQFKISSQTFEGIFSTYQTQHFALTRAVRTEKLN